MPDTPSIRIRSANHDDVGGIADLIHRASTANAILPRSRAEIASYVETFVIAEHDASVVGCAALAAVDPTHAEIRSVAVDPAVQGRGVGLKILKFLVDIADQVEISRLFLVTRNPGFFGAAGFRPEQLSADAPSYLQAMLQRNGRSLDGKCVMVHDLDAPVFFEVKPIETASALNGHHPVHFDTRAL